MALPPRAAAVYVLLSKNGDTPYVNRPTGTTLDNLTGNPPGGVLPPAQPEFFAYQSWFEDYPSENVAKVHLGLVEAGWYNPTDGFGNYIYMMGFTANQHIESSYPDNIVYQYDPTPAPGPADPVPDPNGDTGEIDDTTNAPPNLPGFFYRPRWHLDSAYDVSAQGGQATGVCPAFDTQYVIVPTGFGAFPGTPVQLGPWSVDLEVDNFQSEVLNLEDNTYEYYDFAQLTFNFKQTTTLKIMLDANVCCWNEGTVINGTITFQSINVETTALGDIFNITYPYGFYGMIAETGSTVSEAGTHSFSITISSSYTPLEFEIPTLAGSITFVNDFRIDSITPPS